jgi:hypothetical protein
VAIIAVAASIIQSKRVHRATARMQDAAIELTARMRLHSITAYC